MFTWTYVVSVYWSLDRRKSIHNLNNSFVIAAYEHFSFFLNKLKHTHCCVLGLPQVSPRRRPPPLDLQSTQSTREKEITSPTTTCREKKFDTETWNIYLKSPAVYNSMTWFRFYKFLMDYLHDYVFWVNSPLKSISCYIFKKKRMQQMCTTGI